MKSTPLPLTVSQMTTVGRSLSVAGRSSMAFDEGGHVVAVDLDDVPAEGAPLVGVGLEGDPLLRVARHELAVAVDEGHEVAQLVAAGRHGGLPDRALAGLAVAEQADHAVRLAAVPGAQRHAHRDRQPVPEGPRGCLDARQLHLARVHAVGAVELPVRLDDAVVGEEPAHRHGDVHAHGRVSLAQHEAVAPRVADVMGVHAQPVVEQRGEDVRGREVTADVHGPLVRTAQVEQLGPQLEGPVLQLRHGRAFALQSRWHRLSPGTSC